LLVVISIISILAALLMPALSRARATAKGGACMSNLRQIGIAMQLYVQDNNNRLPVMRDRITGTDPRTNPVPSPDLVISNELGNVKVLRCPADNRAIYEDTGSSYAWNSLLNGQMADHFQVLGLPFDPHQIPLFFDKEGFHAARGNKKDVNYLYADGHIRNLLVLEGTR
jgi:prepilin-type processing-associated H-X9-DG protein